MKKILLTFIILTFSNSTLASDVEVIQKEDHEVRLLKTVNVGDNQVVYLSARNNGHVLGQKFVLETRVSCDGEVSDFTELSVIDSYSVCNMKPESITKNEKGTALAMLAKSANINQYYEDIGEGVSSPEISCNDGNELLKFSLKDLCHSHEHRHAQH